MNKSEYGQFFTQKNMCESILDRVNNIKNIKGSILEPSFGCGNFIHSLSKFSDISVDAVEIDETHFEKFISEGNIFNFNLNTIKMDFLEFENSKQYDFIIGNPPYIEICYSFYDKIKQEKIKKEYDGISNGRINLVHIFLKRSFDMLKSDGVIVFLLPSAILTSPTYKSIRKLKCIN
jgi:tRNA1(Val) A37 N6-methylase TrmN6